MQIKCNRMECLEKVLRREADFLAVDPEDMYVAFRKKNEDFSVFSEIRTVQEPSGKYKLCIKLDSLMYIIMDLKLIKISFQPNFVMRELF